MIRRVVTVILLVVFSSVSVTVFSAQEGKKDINRATVEELTEVKGIGVKKATAIKEFIRKRGGIKSMEELLEVKGIGEKTLEKLKKDFEVKR